MASIYDWSVTANNNSNSDSGINWVEGQLPGTVNGSARAMMGRAAEIVKDLGGALTAGGSANALTITANSAFTTNVNGRFLAFRAASDNTTAATLNVNGIGAKSIRKMTSSGDAALSGAEIQADGIYLVNYSEALNSAAGGWLLVNPTMDLSSFITLTGVATLTNKTFTTGNAFNGTLGATTPASVAGTTGTFSGAVSGTTGTFSGALSGTTGAFSGFVTMTDGTGFQGFAVVGHATNWGGYHLRNSSSQLRWTMVYNGGASGSFAIQRFTGASVYQEDALQIDNATGAVTINGTLTVTG